MPDKTRHQARDSRRRPLRSILLPSLLLFSNRSLVHSREKRSRWPCQLFRSDNLFCSPVIRFGRPSEGSKRRKDVRVPQCASGDHERSDSCCSPDAVYVFKRPNVLRGQGCLTDSLRKYNSIERITLNWIMKQFTKSTTEKKRCIESGHELYLRLLGTADMKKCQEWCLGDFAQKTGVV